MSNSRLVGPETSHCPYICKAFYLILELILFRFSVNLTLLFEMPIIHLKTTHAFQLNHLKGYEKTHTGDTESLDVGR